MTTRISDMKVHEGLAIVTVDGFEPKEETAIDEATGIEYHVGAGVDPLGSANWLCDAYGMADDDQTTGILHTDYDDSGWRFRILIDAEDVEDFRKVAEEAGYDVEDVSLVDEPRNFGDGNGTVEILKHRDGWVVMGG